MRISCELCRNRLKRNVQIKYSIFMLLLLFIGTNAKNKNKNIYNKNIEDVRAFEIKEHFASVILQEILRKDICR